MSPQPNPSDWRATFGHSAGKAVLAYLWQQFWGDDPMYTEGIQGLDLAFREGQRSVVIMLKYAVEDALESTDVPATTYKQE